MKTIGDILKTAREAQKLSQEEVAEKIRKITGESFSRAALAQIENGSTKKPTPNNLLAACDVLKIDFRTALKGELKSTQNKVMEERKQYDAQYNKRLSNAERLGELSIWSDETPLEPDEVALPFFREVKLSAGKGSTEVQENHGCKLRFAKSTLKRQGVQVEHAYCVTVKGNSMEPVLPDGCTVGIDTSNTTVKNGDWYAIDHHGELRVKLIYRLPGGGYRLRSFNSEEWPDEHIQEHEIKILGRVFWWSGLR